MKKYDRAAVLVIAVKLVLSTGCFLLRESGGKIVVFDESHNGDNEPLAVYNTPFSLSPADTELLREGIRLKNRVEVTRIIEDLGIE